MGKVKVSKEVFEALELNKLRYGGSFPYSFIFDFVRGNYIECSDFLRKGVGFKAVINASVKGYELELTPHEKVLENYNLLKSELEKNSNKDVKRELDNCIEVMLITLNNLEIYIEGVNK